MNGYNLSVYDFLVDLVPGVITILLAVSLLPTESIEGVDIAEVTVGSSVLIVVLGYVVGQLVQAVASLIDKQVYFLRREEYPFEQVLEEAPSDSVEEQFAESIEAFFVPDEAETNDLEGYEAFKLTQSYLWNHNIGRGQRFQVLYTFLRSMWVILIAGAGLHFLGLLAVESGEYQLVWTSLQSTVIIVVLGVSGIIAYLRRLKYQNMMVDALIFDFYANVLTQED